MTMTDPVADMLTRIRNASIAYHDTTSCRPRRSR
jgi:small subunit ribosomal protein S8